MGAFPIIMNVVQFWLIDSIVKASNAISLDVNSPNLDDSDYREPLFNAPSDDEDDDVYKSGDVENQRLRHSLDAQRLSRDKSFSSDPDENKSIPSGSGSSAINDEHSYPPSLSSSITSTASSINVHTKAIRPAKNLMKKQRRSPPAPLFIKPLHQPAINSPQVAASAIAASVPKRLPQQADETHPPVIAHQQNTQAEAVEWTESWDDADDWATRVGDEEWTGRRLEDKRNTVNGVWEKNGTTLNDAGTHRS
jgi:hypothetical protein